MSVMSAAVQQYALVGQQGQRIICDHFVLDDWSSPYTLVVCCQGSQELRLCMAWSLVWWPGVDLNSYLQSLEHNPASTAVVRTIRHSWVHSFRQWPTVHAWRISQVLWGEWHSPHLGCSLPSILKWTGRERSTDFQARILQNHTRDGAQPTCMISFPLQTFNDRIFTSIVALRS